MTEKNSHDHFVKEITEILVEGLNSGSLHDFVRWFCFYPNLDSYRWRYVITDKMIDFFSICKEEIDCDEEYDRYEFICFSDPVDMIKSYVDYAVDSVENDRNFVADFRDIEIFQRLEIKRVRTYDDFLKRTEAYRDALKQLFMEKVDSKNPLSTFFSEAIKRAIIDIFGSDFEIKDEFRKLLNRPQDFFLGHIDTSVDQKGVFEYLIRFWFGEIADSLEVRREDIGKYLGYKLRLSSIKSMLRQSPQWNWTSIFDRSDVKNRLFEGLDSEKNFIDRVKGFARLELANRVGFGVWYDADIWYNMGLPIIDHVGLDSFPIAMYFIRKFAEKAVLSDKFLKLIDLYVEIHRLCAWIEITKDGNIFVLQYPPYEFEPIIRFREI